MHTYTLSPWSDLVLLQVNFYGNAGSCALVRGVSSVSASRPVKHSCFEITALEVAFASSYVGAWEYSLATLIHSLCFLLVAVSIFFLQF